MRHNRGFADLVTYIDTELKDKLTEEEQEEIYHLLLVACKSARDSGAANCEIENVDTKKSGWIKSLKNKWKKKKKKGKKDV